MFQFSTWRHFLVILSVPFTSKTSFCSYENAEMLMLAPVNTTTTVDEIIQILDAISTSDCGRTGAEKGTGIPGKMFEHSSCTCRAER